MPTLRILNSTGDTELTWETVDDEKRAVAERFFNDAVKQGHTPFRMNEAREGELIKAFDPEADMVLVPRLVGG